ncbi:MAG: hypothetical protein GEV11_15510 [Streptosporangiales bacterium]|nr:hypothetical protein [Streptosporangiales bacterium]
MLLRTHPAVHYLVALARTRVAAARRAEGGASAIEWAIITGILALLAITIGGLIWTKVKSSADNVNTDFEPPG